MESDCMPISNQHKIGLLCDILKNQADEHYMTDDEASQIARLLQSLNNDPSVDQSVKQIIGEITEQHQLNHEPFLQENVEQWLTSMNQITFDSNTGHSPGNNYK
jgi:hypothetical protein